jgi:hypothetical protein
MKKKSPKNDKRRKKYDKVLSDLDQKFKPWIDTIRESERLTEKDMTLRINV